MAKKTVKSQIKSIGSKKNNLEPKELNISPLSRQVITNIEGLSLIKTTFRISSEKNNGDEQT